jgi:hypothetical protein
MTAKVLAGGTGGGRRGRRRTARAVKAHGTAAVAGVAASLPDDLKADATLSRYADVPALAKAHIEAHKVAKSKVVVPGEGADEATMGRSSTRSGDRRAPTITTCPMPELPVDATDEQRTARDEPTSRIASWPTASA